MEAEMICDADTWLGHCPFRLAAWLFIRYDDFPGLFDSGKILPR
jgi:hypothetical protein